MADEVSEVPQSPLEVRFAVSANEVSESLKKVEELTEIQYVPGFENRIGFFPILENLPDNPLKARFSFGKDAPNMSAVFFDSAKGESEITGERNVRDFLNS